MMAICSIGTFVSRDTGEIKNAPCNSWRCQPCASRKARRFAARYADRAPTYNRFVTLTMPRAATATAEEIRSLSRGFRLLYFRLRRDYGLSTYVWVREQGRASGQIHQHWAIRSSYIPQAELSALCEASGLGRVVDIRRIKGKTELRGYLSKYLVKDGGSGVWPRHTRVVQFSNPRSRPPSTEQWAFFPRAIAPWRRRPEAESGLLETTLEEQGARRGDPLLPSLDSYMQKCARKPALGGADYEPG